MACKALFVVCASALFVQFAFSQCLPARAAPCGFGGLNGLAGGINGFAGSGLGGYGIGAGYGIGGVASTGGGLPVASASPITPVGVSVLSENAYEGVLSAGGNLPFLGTVAVEGVLPTAGVGSVSYGCGNSVGIAAEGPIATGILSSEVFPPSAGIGIAGNGLGGIGYGAGLGNLGGFGYGAGIGNFGGVGSFGGIGYGAGIGNGINGLGCGCGAL